MTTELKLKAATAMLAIQTDVLLAGKDFEYVTEVAATTREKIVEVTKDDPELYAAMQSVAEDVMAMGEA